MDKLPIDKTTSTEDVPHSGNLPGKLNDLPYRTFETSLEDATKLTNESGEPLLKAPNNAADLLPKKSRKGMYFGLSGIAVGAAGVIIAVNSVLGGAASPQNEVPHDQPVATASGEVNGETEIKVPAEAKDFVDAFGTRYKDPVATYYAEAAFEKETNGDALTIGDDYINTYNFESTVNGGRSPLGFNILSLPFETEINVQSSVDQFNTALPTMNRAINLLSKNPTPQEISVISDEFSLYSGYGNEDNAAKLIAFFNTIIAKHGTNSNYTINTASSEATDPAQSTIFDAKRVPFIHSENKDGKAEIFENPITLSISVETYDSENRAIKDTDITEYFSFMVSRAPAEIDPLGGGFVAIGTQTK